MNKFKKILAAVTTGVLLFASSAFPSIAAEPWNVTGNYVVTFKLDGDLSNTPYMHDASLTQSGASVSGTGGFPASGPYSHTWHVTSGSISGSTITLAVLYDTGATGTVMNMTGTIAADGTVTGTWSDNFGGARTGTWSITNGVSVPKILTPANNATVSQSALDKVDWTDSIGANPPFTYQYEAFSDAGYTTSVYQSGWLTASEIPTPGTPLGSYYLRVRARDASTTVMSDWSNNAVNPYKVTVISDSVTPTPDPFAIPAECSGMTLGAPIIGTNGANTINGTNGNDLIFAMGGADTINGNGGDDCIVAGNGSDLINAGNGDDVVLGGNGDDVIMGGNGNDKLYGEEGNDSIDGGNDNDMIWGGANNDSLAGGNGVDTINGGSGNDSLSGGNGADNLDGDLGNDAANGGAATDTCIAEAKTSCEM